MAKKRQQSGPGGAPVGGDQAGAAGDAPPPGGRSGLQRGNGDRVLDKGVWKRWKRCQHCQQVLVERAKWKDCWEEIRFCSDRCKAEAKRERRLQQELEQQQKGGSEGAAAAGTEQQEGEGPAVQ